jgi:hypothetical protein
MERGISPLVLNMPAFCRLMHEFFKEGRYASQDENGEFMHQ